MGTKNDEKISRLLFRGCSILIIVLLLTTRLFILPAYIQMSLYSFSLLYVGAHASLKLREIDATTGKVSTEGEVMSRKDAMLFPVIGSCVLVSLFLAMKFLSLWWVNLLVALYCGFAGPFAITDGIDRLTDGMRPPSWEMLLCDRRVGFSRRHRYVMGFPINLLFEELEFQDWEVKFSKFQAAIFVASMGPSVAWVTTNDWTCHNILAIAYSVQALRLISVGTFKIAATLLSALFVYDIFFVFGTNVMVSVASKLNAPAKLMFPRSFVPWKTSMLGLGDIVLPGLLIAMTLRFDRHMNLQRKKSDEINETKICITEPFPKPHFWTIMAFYQAALGVTNIAMVFFEAPQPALLYLVPACFVALTISTFVLNHPKELLEYTEEETPAETADGGSVMNRPSPSESSSQSPNDPDWEKVGSTPS